MKQETGVEDLARMNQNKHVLDSGPQPWRNPDDTGRYSRKENRTEEEVNKHPELP